MPRETTVAPPLVGGVAPAGRERGGTMSSPGWAV